VIEFFFLQKNQQLLKFDSDNIMADQEHDGFSGCNKRKGTI